jgi:hypothetical protein
MSFFPAYLTALLSNRQILMRSATGAASRCANDAQAPTAEADRRHHKPQRHIEAAKPVAVEAFLEGT